MQATRLKPGTKVKVTKQGCWAYGAKATIEYYFSPMKSYKLKGMDGEHLGCFDRSEFTVLSTKHWWEFWK